MLIFFQILHLKHEWTEKFISKMLLTSYIWLVGMSNGYFDIIPDLADMSSQKSVLGSSDRIPGAYP